MMRHAQPAATRPRPPARGRRAGRSLLLALVAAGLLLGAARAGEKSAGHGAKLPKPPRYEKPRAGDYHLAILNLGRITKDLSYRVCVPLRGGTGMIHSPRSLRESMGDLSLKKGKLAGSFHWKTLTADFKLTCKATVSEDGQVAGTWETFGVYEGLGKGGKRERKTGAVTGRLLTGAALAADPANAVDPTKSWPDWLGPEGNLTVPADHALIDHLSEARQVWRSEEPIPTGQGNAVPFGRLGRYVPTAWDQPTIGGGATAVVADGKVYAYYIQPDHTGPFEERAMKEVGALLRGRKAGGEMLAAMSVNDMGLEGGLDPGAAADPDDPFAAPAPAGGGAVAKEANVYAREKWAERADEVVVCMDARSGETLWKTVFPSAGKNMQDHKRGPVNCTPCTDGERVYATGTTGRVYALDADTGKLLWTAHMPTAGAVSDDTPYTGYHQYANNFNQAPTLVAGVLLVPDHQYTLYAFDPATGKELWRKAKGVGRAAVPMGWRHGETDYVLTVLDARQDEDPREVEAYRILCLEAKTGEEAWRLERPTIGRKGFGLAGDRLVLLGEVETGQKGPTERPVAITLEGYALSPAGAKKRWATKLGGSKMPTTHLLPPMTEAHVYTSGPGGHVILDAKTGAILAHAPGTGANNEGMGIVIGDRLLVRIDSCHGNGAMNWVIGGPADFREQGQAAGANAPMAQPGSPDADSPDAGPEGAGATAGARKAKPGEAADRTYSLPHPPTNSYHEKPISIPYVDGRIFLRGVDGIYCYDLRKPSSAD